MDKGVAPSRFCDEITPPPREHPNDWIAKERGLYYLESPESWYADEETGIDNVITDGEVYEFQRLVTFGDATLTIRADGSFSVDRPMPKEANSVFVPVDPDTLSDDVERLVENCGDDLGAGEHPLEYFAWTEERWRFDGDRKRFVKAETDGEGAQ